MKTFATKIDGQACWCRVTHYKPYVPARFGYGPENCEPAIPSEFEFTILTSEGSPAPELEELARADESIFNRLQDEYEAFITAVKHGKEF